MEYTDEQAELFWRVVHDNNSVRHTEMARQYGHRQLERLHEAGFNIEFPDMIEYRVHRVAMRHAASYAVYKYVNGERDEWIGDFNHESHAEDMANLLTNDLPQINLRS